MAQNGLKMAQNEFYVGQGVPPAQRRAVPIRGFPGLHFGCRHLPLITHAFLGIFRKLDFLTLKWPIMAMSVRAPPAAWHRGGGGTNFFQSKTLFSHSEHQKKVFSRKKFCSDTLPTPAGPDLAAPPDPQKPRDGQNQTTLKW